MKKRICVCLLAACMLLGLMPAALAREGTPETRVVFEGSAPDADGCFTVTMTMYDVTFRVYQFALRYDPQVVQSVDPSGAPAETFGDFARMAPENNWLSTVGTELNPETGLIDFSGYIMPGTTGPGLNEVGECVVGEDGLVVYTFYFRQLEEGDPALQVATEEKGEPYRPACPQGVIVGGEAGTIPVTVTFRMAEGTGGENSEQFTGQEENQPPEEETRPPEETPEPEETPGPTEESGPTAEELLDGSVILELGSHAALVEGGVTAIYPGERSVTAYAHDNRTFVPVRCVAERLGAQVGWENDTQTVVIEKDGRTVRMAVGSLTYTLDGVEQAMDVPAEFQASTGGNSRTMVPIRFVTEALGYQVEWDQSRNLVIVADPALGWDLAGETENQALDEAVSRLALYGGFV